MEEVRLNSHNIIEFYSEEEGHMLQISAIDEKRNERFIQLTRKEAVLLNIALDNWLEETI